MIYSVPAAVAQSRSKLREYTSRRDIVIVVVVVAVVVVVPMTGFSTRLLAACVHFCRGGERVKTSGGGVVLVIVSVFLTILYGCYIVYNIIAHRYTADETHFDIDT